MLADIGAFASFGYERREALWQVEKAVRPSGELFDRPEAQSPGPEGGDCPLPPMNTEERLVADYAGTHLTIGPHPMAMRRTELAMRGVLRAIDLARGERSRPATPRGTHRDRDRGRRVTSVKAERLHGLGGARIDVDSHDFH